MVMHHRVEPSRRGSLLLKQQVLPDKPAEKAGLTSTCQELGWPSCINGSRAVVVMHTKSDFVTGTVHADASLAATEVRLTLNTASHITWWKGVEIVREIVKKGPSSANLSDKERFEVLTGVYTQDEFHGPDACEPFKLEAMPGQDLYLQFRKAGAFGVHTAVSRIPLYLEGGQSLVLNWERDGSVPGM